MIYASKDDLKALGIEVVTTWTVRKDFVHENLTVTGLGKVHQFFYDGSKEPTKKTETDS